MISDFLTTGEQSTDKERRFFSYLGELENPLKEAGVNFDKPRPELSNFLMVTTFMGSSWLNIRDGMSDHRSGVSTELARGAIIYALAQVKVIVDDLPRETSFTDKLCLMFAYEALSELTSETGPYNEYFGFPPTFKDELFEWAKKTWGDDWMSGDDKYTLVRNAAARDAVRSRGKKTHYNYQYADRHGVGTDWVGNRLGLIIKETKKTQGLSAHYWFDLSKILSFTMRYEQKTKLGRLVEMTVKRLSGYKKPDEDAQFIETLG